MKTPMKDTSAGRRPHSADGNAPLRDAKRNVQKGGPPHIPNFDETMEQENPAEPIATPDAGSGVVPVDTTFDDDAVPTDELRAKIDDALKDQTRIEESLEVLMEIQRSRSNEEETKLAEVSAHIAAMEDELARERSRSAELTQLLQQREVRLSEIQRDSEVLRAASSQSKSHLDVIEQREMALRQMFQQAMELNQAQKEQIADVQALLSKERQEVAKLTELLASAERALATEREGAAELTAEKATAEALLAKERLQSKVLRTLLTEAESTLGDELTRAMRAESALRITRHENQEIKRASEEAQMALSDCSRRADARAAADAAAVASLQRELSQERQHSATVMERESRADAERAAMEKRETALRQALEETERTRQVSDEQIANLQKALSEEHRRGPESSVVVAMADSELEERCNNLELKLIHEAEKKMVATRSTFYRLGRTLRLRKKDHHQKIDANLRLIECFLSQFEPHRLGITGSTDQRVSILRYLLELSNELVDFPLFSSAFYLANYKDVETAGVNALAHYLRYGGKEGRESHILFDAQFYREQSPDVCALGELPVSHYIKWGAEKGRNPHPLFDTSHYLKHDRDALSSGMNPLVHYLKYSNSDPHPLFDTAFYTRCNPDVARSRQNPLINFLTSNPNEWRNPHPLFDTKFYLSTYPDVASTGMNPLVHFITVGALQRRRPNSEFDTNFYLEKYADVFTTSMNPLVHYVTIGALEDRQIRAPTVSREISSTRTVGTDRQTDRPCALMIDAMYPRPDQDSGSNDQISFIGILKALGYQIYFVADIEFGVVSNYRKALEDMGVTCVAYPTFSSFEEFLSLKADDISLCFLSRVHFGGRHFETLRTLCPNAKIIFNTVDLHYVREEQEAKLTKNNDALAQALETRERELHVICAADATIVVSLKEQEMLKQIVPSANVSMVPLIRNYTSIRKIDFEHRSGVGFIGGFLHQPNVDAVNHFLDHIWPRVHDALPQVKFSVIGSNLPDHLAARRDPGVVFVGYVQDLEAWLDKLRLTVAPLRYGSGAKGKIVSSLGHGVPCVASPIAAEGMGLEEGVHVAIGDSPERFADEIIAVYQDAKRWLKFSEGGRELIRQQYSMKHGVELVGEILKSIGVKISAE
jgi:glycosyltransferase involved in cell wall biosynthesis